MAQKKTRKGIEVEFGTVSFRKRVAAIGLKFSDSEMPVDDREAFLKKAQLEVSMKIDKSAGSDVDGQDRFFETDMKFDGIGEIHSYTTGDDVSCVLSFPINDTDKMSLVEMRCAKGKIDMKRTGDAEEKKRGRPRKDDDEDGDEEDVVGQQRITVGK